VACGAAEDGAEAELRASALRHRAPRLTLAAGAPGGPGYADRTGKDVRLGEVQDMALAPDGSLVFADAIVSGGSSVQHTVLRRLSPDGSVSTLLGRARDPLRTQCDGPAAEAGLFEVDALAVTPEGAIYILEPGWWDVGSVLRRVEPSGEVTTLLGRLPACDDPTQLREGIWGPTLAPSDYLKLAPSGDLLVSQSAVVSGNPAIGRLVRIRVASGALETLVDAIGLPPEQGGRSSMFALAPDGTLFFADAGRHAILAVAADGSTTTVAGALGAAGNVDGPAELARFDTPGAIAWHPSGDLYVADQRNASLRRITPEGLVSTVPDTTPLGASALVVDASGRLLVAHRFQWFGSAIEAITPAGERSAVLVGLPERSGSTDGRGGSARFFRPWGLDADDHGNVFIADGNDVIRKLDRRGRVTTIAGTLAPRAPGEPSLVDGPAARARFSSINDVAVDRASGILYVAEDGNAAVRRIDPDGTVSTIARVESGPPPTLGALSVTSGGDVLFVGDPYSTTVWRVTPEGEQSVFAEMPHPALSVVAAPDGGAYVACGDVLGLVPEALQLYSVSPDGEATAIAPLTALPADMTIDAEGRLYVVQQAFDPGWSTVSRLAPDGTLRPLLGDGVYAGVALGPLDTAGINLVRGVAASGQSLYVSDLVENAILKLAPLPR
jgi:sugar lactone lactonase YvrE